MFQRFKRLFSESTTYTLGNMLNRSFSIVTMPIFTRCLATSEYGILAVVRTVRDLIEVVYEMGTSASSTRFYYDCVDAEQEKRLFSTLFFFTMGSGICLSLLILLWGEPLWNWMIRDIPFYPFVPLAVFTVLMTTVGVLPRTLFRVQGRAKTFVTLSFMQSLCIVAISIFFVLGFGMGALGPLTATLIVSVLFFFIYLYCLRKHLALVFSWRLVRQSLAFGLPDSPVRFGNWALKTANQLILQHYLSLSLVAVYSVGYSVGSILFELVINGLHWAILPFYYQTYKEETEHQAKQIFAYVAAYNFALILFLALTTSLMGSELLAFFASSKYTAAESIIQIIVISCIAQFLFFIPSRGFYLSRKTIYLPPLLFITVCINVLLCFLLVPKYGVAGAAWSTMFAYMVRSMITFMLSQRVFFIPYQYGRMGKCVLAFLPLLLFGLFLPPWPKYVLIPVKILALLSYPIMLKTLGFFEKRELEQLRRQWANLSNLMTSWWCAGQAALFRRRSIHR